MIELAYGDRHINLELPENIKATVVMPMHFETVGESREMIARAMANPINSASLGQIIADKKARNAVIIVNDITRPTPYEQILPPILAELQAGGIPQEKITLIVATGIHRPHTEQDNLTIFGEKICSKYRIINHDPDNNLAHLGKLSNGMDLIINKTAAEADILITTGVVSLHYFAGYSGGRKSILPGISSRSTIEANHKMMNDPRSRLGNYEDNPVSSLMIEAARKAGVDYIVNVVLHNHHEAAFCAAGDLEKAWLEAVRFCEKMNVVEIEQAADIVVASCGGYPKDMNMYQAQKAMDAAILAVKPGGTMILLAECREGLGEETFADWIEQAGCPDDIVKRFHEKFELGGHKAFAICRTIENAEVLLLSDLPARTVNNLFLSPIQSLEEGIRKACLRHGGEASLIVLPEAPKMGIKIKKKE